MLPQPWANPDTERPSWAVRMSFALWFPRAWQISPELTATPTVGLMMWDGQFFTEDRTETTCYLKEATESPPSVYLWSLLAWFVLKPKLLVFPWASLFSPLPRISTSRLIHDWNKNWCLVRLWCTLHGFYAPSARPSCGFWRSGVSVVLSEQTLYQ